MSAKISFGAKGHFRGQEVLKDGVLVGYVRQEEYKGKQVWWAYSTERRQAIASPSATRKAAADRI